MYLAVYVGARWLGAGMVGGRLLERRLGVHPALLIPSIVILTEFDWIWLFIAAPVVSMAVNTVQLPPRAAVRAAAARRRPAMGSRSADRYSERARPGGGGCACAGCLSIDDVCEVTR